MTAANVNSVQMANTTITSSHCNVLQLNVHVILGFQKLATVGLTRRELECNDMALR